MRLRASLWLAIVVVAAAVAATEARATTTCGNGALDEFEWCDDGNAESGDGCSPECLPEECADGILTPGTEECDDGNTVAGDGCDAACRFECGNGVVDAGELCDTGGSSAECDADCTPPECGDQIANELAGELCDDGNTVVEDGCFECDIVDFFPVPPAPQRCVREINDRFAAVARAEAADVVACFRAATAGELAVADCFGADRSGKVAKAQARVSAAFASTTCRGENIPSFAFTTPAIVSRAAELEILAAFTAVFGDPSALVGRASDAAGARCQGAAAKQIGAIASRQLAEANRAKKAALKGGKGGIPPAAGSSTELGAALDSALDGSEALAKAEARASAAIGKACAGAPVGDLFACPAATTPAEIAACVITAAEQAACEALELADAIPLDCPTLAP